ncbi:MAG: O-antigen polysaccharide polymerase Wzy [Pseudolysinimonas sp.]
MPLWRRPEPRALVIGILFAGVLSGSYALAAAQSDLLAAIAVVVTSCTVLSACVIVLVRAPADPLASVRPSAFPLLYIFYAFVVPQLYMVATGNGIASIARSTLSPVTVSVMCGFTLSALLGGAFVHAVSRPEALPPSAGALSPESRLTALRQRSVLTVAGRAGLAVALAIRIVQIVTQGTVFDSVYGSNQLDFTAVTSLAVIGDVLIPVSALMVMHANVARGRFPLSRLDGVLLASVLIVSVVFLGSRAEAIPPAIIFVYYFGRSGRRIRWVWLILGAVVVAMAFVAVSQFRSVQTGPGYPIVEELLRQTATPQRLTYNVTTLVPSEHSFFYGSTYLVALEYMLPGPLSRALFGAIPATGTFVYRDLIHFDDPNQGFGFAMPTEAYLNFGLVGTAVVGAAVGALLVMTWRSAHVASPRSTRFAPFVYPLLVSAIPYAMRSDLLAQLKNTVYPLALVFVLLAAAALATRIAIRNHRIRLHPARGGQVRADRNSLRR